MGKGKWETKKRERDCTDEALALPNHLKLLMNLWIGYRHRIQTLKEAPAKGPQAQLTKGWTATEDVLDSFELLLIATYPSIVRLNSVPHPRQRPNLKLSKPSSQPVLALSIAGHKHLETTTRSVPPTPLHFPLTHSLLP